jgi:Uma2 family endonuclease
MGFETAATLTKKTLQDLSRVSGKAELIGGRIVYFMPTGYLPGFIAGDIFVSLKQHTRVTGQGAAFPDNVGFAVPELPSGRESFSPDAAYYDGPVPPNAMDFVPGPPALAVEVRSTSDYGDAAEAEMTAKRSDYFQAGTKVVWDVDPIACCVHVYRADAPGQPATFSKGQVADAEPAVPGWRMAVVEIFP